MEKKEVSYFINEQIAEDADKIRFNHSHTGYDATNVQDAIDEQYDYIEQVATTANGADEIARANATEITNIKSVIKDEELECILGVNATGSAKCFKRNGFVYLDCDINRTIGFARGDTILSIPNLNKACNFAVNVNNNAIGSPNNVIPVALNVTNNNVVSLISTGLSYTVRFSGIIAMI